MIQAKALRYKHTEEESGFAEGWSRTTVTSQSQEPSETSAIPRALPLLASSAIHQSLSILLILSTAETPVIGQA